MSTLEELEAAAWDLEQLRYRHACELYRALQRRDDLIRTARNEGASLRAIGAFAGLSATGVLNSLRRSSAEVAL